MALALLLPHNQGDKRAGQQSDRTDLMDDREHRGHAQHQRRNTRRHLGGQHEEPCHHHIHSKAPPDLGNELPQSGNPQSNRQHPMNELNHVLIEREIEYVSDIRRRFTKHIRR